MTEALLGLNPFDDSNPSRSVAIFATRIFVLLLTAISVHISLSPPNPPLKSDECCSGTKGTDTLFEKVVQSVTYCSKCMVWMGTVLDMLAISLCMTSLDASDPHPYLHVHSLRLRMTLDTHPLMTAGALLTAFGTLLRLWCFKSLGPLFTFEIAIRPKHELVTYGPYSWVRHPSYTGVYMTLIGATLVLAAPGTWTFECGLRSVFGLAAAVFWVFKCCFAFRGMTVRLKAEDDVLRETFGYEWDAYAQRVPSTLLPCIL